jgi:hypothetical protein
MTLGELLEQLDSLEDEAVIYAATEPKLDCFSAAVALLGDSDSRPLEDINGMKYLLEVNIAKEVLDVWKSWRQGRTPTRTEKCEAVIYYALKDAYLPVSS